MRKNDVSPGRESSSMVNAARRTLARISLGVASVLAGFLPLVASGSPPDNPHAYFEAPETCPRCHGISRGEIDPARFPTGADALCLECHRKENLGRTHPVSIRPADRHANRNRKIPADFPLDEEGRMMCLTCHTAHGPYLSSGRTFPTQAPEGPATGGGTRYKTLYLRRSSPVRGFETLCDACHEKL
jgi:hypothetical protein